MVTGRVAGDGAEFMAHMKTLRLGGRVDVRDGVATGSVYVQENQVALAAEGFLIDVRVTRALAPPTRWDV